VTREHIAIKINDGITDSTPEVVAEVKVLQTCLIHLGFLGKYETADGKFGLKTEAAVKAFQEKNNLTPDGIVDQKTWGKLAGVSPSEIEITPRPELPGYNLDKIPSVWRAVSTPIIPILIKAFSDQGIKNPRVLAYACATIGRESSWNPWSVNRTDSASKTGYPGAGLAQITWKDNYQMVSNKTGIDFVSHPEYMFDPYKSLRAKVAFYQVNGMIPYIEKQDYQSAAGIYNAGRASYRSSYTRNVANDVGLWLPVFNG